MLADKNKHSYLTRRAFILGSIQGLLLTSVLGRLYGLQVLSKSHYQTLSDKNRLHSYLVIPDRGHILDRSGLFLAINQVSYRAILVRDQVDNWQESLARTAEFLELNEEDIQRITKEVRRKPRFVPTIIKDNLTWDELTRLKLHQWDISGVSIESGCVRQYPFPLETGHVLGYVAAPSEKDRNGDPVLELPGMRIGKNGVEKIYERQLQGKPGIKQVEVNASRRVVREISTSASQPGDTLTLSLDLSLQQTVATLLKDQESAAVVVMEAASGQILSALSVPGYDTNLFTKGISQKDWQSFLTHPRHCLINKVTTGQYAPGSTFKMVVALAALEQGVIDNYTSVECTGHVSLGGHKFHCWDSKRGGHGHISLQAALARSCDVYFFHVAGLVGIDPIAQMAMRLGFGQSTTLEMPGEKGGLIPTRNWKRKIMGKGWTLGETYNASIGQGYVLATPLQMTLMMARLVTNKKVDPTLLHNAPNFEPLNLNPQHLEWVMKGMIEAVEPGGTVYNARIGIPALEMGGKTGTSQVRSISARDRQLGQTSTANHLWEYRDHALFVGYAPIHKPRFVTCVLIEHGVSGGKVAAPLGRDILIAAQKLVA